MIIQYISDLHLEFGNSLDGIENCDSDVIVIAGDLSIYQRVIFHLFEIKQLTHKPIIYVPGNHEYYHTTKEVQDEIFRNDESVLKESDIFILNNNTIKIDDVVFIGSTGWWDRNFDSRLKQYLNDFNLIGDIENANDGIKWGIESKKFFEQKLIKHQGEKIVCVSHNNPTLESPYKFILSPLNVFFNNDWCDLIEEYKPNYWIYGHCHDCMEFDCYDTKMLCNPKGYPNENNRFSFNRTIVI